MEVAAAPKESGVVDYLADERRQAQFDLQAMKILLAGGEQELLLNKRMDSIVANDPVFRKDDRVHLDRSELIKRSIQKATHAWKLVQDLRLTAEEASKLRKFVDENSFADLHWGMFIPSLQGQATEEQQKKWLPLANKMAIIGCYAQTELGHGSNVQGLETTASFDYASDEFVMNSPTLTSSKWWPGGLGKSSTHAIVYARLILGEQDYGIHAFIVPVRSLEDHKPLPGITVGDIGVKFGNGGYNAMDNGFLRFDHVRIPRDNMLMKLSEVTKEGKYIRSKVPRQLNYGAMVYVRQSLVSGSSETLSRAVTVAVRYSAVRRQFGAHDGHPEVQVIDYKTQQNRLFPLLATAYAFRFTGEWMKSLYKDVMSRLQASDYSTLPEAHACTAGLKSLTTSVTANGIEECRKLCGGHGYLCASGLPELYANYVPACTFEGDNVILLLQVARFLLRTLSQSGSGIQPAGTAAYLGNMEQLLKKKCNVTSGQDWLNASVLLDAFEVRSAQLAVSCATKVAKASSYEAGFEEYAVDLVEAAQAHCELIVVSKFIEKLHTDIPGKGVKQQLHLLSSIYALSLLVNHVGDFFSSHYLTSEQTSFAKDQLRLLLTKVRPNAVALVDAFDHSDYYLGSTLGRYDGDVYTHLYEGALKDPLNRFPATEGYTEYLRPMLKQQVKGVHSRL
ncbi:hypothetical protein O6H91_Y145000 [Diphasiastrum complanatum]|nr:hypothetical protein O6H91_Y145000 [Diphasiastrum complanatum]